MTVAEAEVSFEPQFYVIPVNDAYLGRLEIEVSQTASELWACTAHRFGEVDRPLVRSTGSSLSKALTELTTALCAYAKRHKHVRDMTEDFITSRESMQKAYEDATGTE